MKKWIILLMILIMLCAAGCAAETSEEPEESLVGSIVRFGKYEQDNNTGNGPEDIQWTIVDVQDGKALLVSWAGLDTQPYHTGLGDVTWEKCSLRTWLNHDFFETAFDETEAAAILTVNVANSDDQGYPDFTTDGGADTEDQVFLLSSHEVLDLYYTTQLYRKCAPTDYAVEQGAWISYDDNANGRPAGIWWLRSPGDEQSQAMLVHFDGSPSFDYVNETCYAVRPAIWVDLSSGVI